MLTKEQKIKVIREIIRNNPTLSAKEHIELAQKKKAGIRKTDFLKERRDVLKLSEPTIEKKEKSIPIKHRTTFQKRKIALRVKPTPKITVQKKIDIPFEKTKFGKITRRLQKTHRISEKKAIIHARRILKIPKSDYHKINQLDVQILLDETP